MNLHHLAVFHAVAETGSIAAAASRLHISQPAISRQVRDFEHRLDTVLFDRLPRGMRLTASGAALATYARRIFALERQAERALAELCNLDSGYLAVGASTTIGNYLVPSVLAEYKCRHPGIHITLEVDNTDAIQKQLIEERLDIGLTEGLAGTSALHVEEFMSDQLVVVAAPGLIPDRTGRWALEEIAALPWVMRERGSGTRAVLEQILAADGLEPRETMALASTEAVKRAVATGAGIAVVSALTVSAELERGELIQLSAEGFPRRRPLHLLKRRHHQPGLAVTAFLELLLNPGPARQ